MVKVVATDNLTGSAWRCSGVAIGPRTVITAAHCVYEPCQSCLAGQCQPGRVHGGDLTVSETESGDLSDELTHSVTDAYLQPTYPHLAYVADVAVLTLSDDLVTVSAFPTLETRQEFAVEHLPPPPGWAWEKKVGPQVSLVGFGLTSDPGPSSHQDCSAGPQPVPAPTAPFAPPPSVAGADVARRSGTARRMIGPSLLPLHEAIPEAEDDAIICSGDSGGGMFDDTSAQRKLIGILVAGDCQTVSYAESIGVNRTFIEAASPALGCVGDDYSYMNGRCVPSCAELARQRQFEFMPLDEEAVVADSWSRVACARTDSERPDTTELKPSSQMQRWERLDTGSYYTYDCPGGCFLDTL